MFMKISDRKFWISCNEDSSKLTVTWIDDVKQKEVILLLQGEKFTIYEVIQRLEKWSLLSDNELYKLSMGEL